MGCMCIHIVHAVFSSTDSECDNILVVGSGDLRHVLKTIAHSTKPLHVSEEHYFRLLPVAYNSESLSVSMQFYVAESSLELLARHMMFLTLISEPLNKLGLQGE